MKNFSAFLILIFSINYVVADDLSNNIYTKINSSNLTSTQKIISLKYLALYSSQFACALGPGGGDSENCNLNDKKLIKNDIPQMTNNDYTKSTKYANKLFNSAKLPSGSGDFYLLRCNFEKLAEQVAAKNKINSKSHVNEWCND